MALSRFLSLVLAASSVTVPYLLYKMYKWTKSIKKLDKNPTTNYGLENLAEENSPTVSGQVKAEDKSLDETTARNLFTLLCCDEDCRLEFSVAVKRLGEVEGKSLNQKEVLTIVELFPEMFQVVNVEGSKLFIEAKSSVSLCDSFQSGMCETLECKKLHICRFFLQDSCKYGVLCLKPHTFDSPQTRSVLEESKLNLLPPNALRNLFNKMLNLKIIKHKSISSGPSPCRFYNKGECKNGDKCEFLHVCEYYITGYCKFGEDRCVRTHHFDDPQSRRILEAHRLGGLRSRSEILTILRNRSSGNLSGSYDRSSSDDDDVFFL